MGATGLYCNAPGAASGASITAPCTGSLVCANTSSVGDACAFGLGYTCQILAVPTNCAGAAAATTTTTTTITITATGIIITSTASASGGSGSGNRSGGSGGFAPGTSVGSSGSSSGPSMATSPALSPAVVAAVSSVVAVAILAIAFFVYRARVSNSNNTNGQRPHPQLMLPYNNNDHSNDYSGNSRYYSGNTNYISPSPFLVSTATKQLPVQQPAPPPPPQIARILNQHKQQQQQQQQQQPPENFLDRAPSMRSLILLPPSPSTPAKDLLKHPFYLRKPAFFYKDDFFDDTSTVSARASRHDPFLDGLHVQEHVASSKPHAAVFPSPTTPPNLVASSSTEFLEDANDRVRHLLDKIKTGGAGDAGAGSEVRTNVSPAGLPVARRGFVTGGGSGGGVFSRRGFENISSESQDKNVTAVTTARNGTRIGVWNAYDDSSTATTATTATVPALHELDMNATMPPRHDFSNVDSGAVADTNRELERQNRQLHAVILERQKQLSAVFSSAAGSGGDGGGRTSESHEDLLRYEEDWDFVDDDDDDSEVLL
ncbi:hypothetical protein HK100_005001 [Physocladia obscura]|uniref:Uncharacterized protein n=1 Tax=Physocladia obscura TaxID=109957 RepID=A0AAD5SS63_9FUNG|nr:hypothetical protein HK100_005001 [Physocladia obscura]